MVVVVEEVARGPQELGDRLDEPGASRSQRLVEAGERSGARRPARARCATPRPTSSPRCACAARERERSPWSGSPRSRARRCAGSSVPRASRPRRSRPMRRPSSSSRAHVDALELARAVEDARRLDELLVGDARAGLDVGAARDLALRAPRGWCARAPFTRIAAIGISGTAAKRVRAAPPRRRSCARRKPRAARRADRRAPAASPRRSAPAPRSKSTNVTSLRSGEMRMSPGRKPRARSRRSAR